MSVIGIDPSLSAFSWVHLIKGEIQEIKTIKTKPKDYPLDAKGRIERYHQIIKSVIRYTIEHTPDIVVVEGYSFGSKGQGVTKLAELGGVLRDRLYLTSGVLIEVAPTSLKKFATRKGNSDKKAVLQSLSQRYEKKFSCHDEADAFGLAKIGECLTGTAFPSTKFEKEAIEVIRRGIRENNPVLYADIETIRINNTLK